MAILALPHACPAHAANSLDRPTAGCQQGLFGARYQSGPWQAEATGFLINYEDQVVKQPDNSLKNLGETRYQGIETRLAWAPHSLPFSLEGTWTWLDTEQRSGELAGNVVPNAPNHLLNLLARWEQGRWFGNIGARYVDKSFADAANTAQETENGSTGPLPDYWLVDAGRHLLGRFGALIVRAGVHHMDCQDNLNQYFYQRHGCGRAKHLYRVWGQKTLVPGSNAPYLG